MWYEILPSLAVIGICMTMPQIISYAGHRLFLGTPYKRWITTDEEYYHFLRDARLSGKDFAYKQLGLENLSLDDEDDKKNEKSK